MSSPNNREFFSVLTVSAAVAGFRPGRRTPTENVALGEALGRVPSEPVRAPHDLPGFPRSTVDGFAVRAADTYGASDGLPGYLEVLGAVQMGMTADVELRSCGALAIPTGGMMPVGADAVVMIEHTSEAMAGTIEIHRAVAPGEGLVRGDEDAKSGDELTRAGRPLRPHDLGLLASAGVTTVRVHARPRVAILSTGDEVVPYECAELLPGQVRDACALPIAALVREAGGEPVPCGIVPDDPEALREALLGAMTGSDLIVITAGSSVGARDETAGVVASLGEPGIFCHGLALQPGKPTLLAQCGDVPIIGLPGNPRSALVVFRLIGSPLVRLVGGWEAPVHEPVVRARLSRDLPSVAGRLDVVQVRLLDGLAEPIFGKSALLSMLVEADGYLTVPEPATGLDEGADVEVTLYR
ncbi:MAG TPA: gephyrin-like molybdotransferase Glp [Acidimicrobiales bacterium]|nr:gephyrin-like molybdotransferase Glp [Acidimicrobiales bacterium]HLN05395.1 gephyrin-like molybdotransferase Glp [Acidimicrobiales bacterium]